MRRRWTGFGVAVVLLASAAPAAAAPAAAGTAYERAIRLERSGDFHGALTLLERARLDSAEAAHRAALRRAVAGFAAAGVYASRGQPALAAAVLRGLGRRLDPVRDVYLRSADERLLVALPSPPSRSSGPGFAARVWHGFTGVARTILSWLLVAACVALAVAALWGASRWWRARRTPRGGVGVALEDLSAPPANRVDASRTLGRQLSIAIEAANASPDEETVPEIDVAKDLDGSISVNVRVAGDELASLDRMLDGGEPIKAGPISVSPRQLAAFANALLAPRYAHELSGALVDAPDRTEVAVELRGDGRTIRWACAKSGAESRVEAIAEVARRVVFELGARQLSQSWPSVAAYRQARQLLVHAQGAGAGRGEALGQARTLLEQALAHDPANLLARFELGNVLRKLGSNDEAVMQYAVLDAFSDAREVPAVVRRAAAYSRAVALSKISTWPTYREAVATLDALRADVESDAQLDPLDRDHLLALTRSAKAAAQLFELERLRGEEGDRGRAHRDAVLAEMTAARDWIAATERSGGLRKATYYQALAVAENAVGRGTYLCGGRQGDAIDAFEHALSLVPELGDAHVNLAAALLRKRSPQEGWAERIRRHLDRALEISPNDRKARYLHGQVCLRLGERAPARRWFELSAADGDAWAAFRLAQLSYEDGALADAVERARESLLRLGGSDVRARSLVLWTAQLAARPQDGASPAALAAAHRAGGAIVKDAQRRRVELPDALARAVRLVDAVAAMQDGG